MTEKKTYEKNIDELIKDSKKVIDERRDAINFDDPEVEKRIKEALEREDEKENQREIMGSKEEEKDISDIADTNKKIADNAKWRKDDVPPAGSSDSALQLLLQRANAVDLSRLGLLACDMNPFVMHPMVREYLYKLMKIGIANALLTYMAQVEAQLVIRDISPYQDLLDGTESFGPYNEPKRITHNQWFQPTTIAPSLWSNYDEQEKIATIYQTNKNSRNDQKIMLIYGFEFLNGWKNRCVERIDIWSSNVKLITYVDIDRRAPNIFNMNLDVPVLPDSAFEEKQKISYLTGVPNSIYHNDIILMNTAVLFKRNDNMQIKFRFGKDVPRDFDEIKIRGFVIELLGQNVMG